MMANARKLKVFLCHASQDKPAVRELYQRLHSDDWIDPWLDEEVLLPGQDWDMEIEKAVEASDAVIVCLSNQSVTKEGYVQRELKFVLDIALEKPEGTIFVVPLRLDDCNLPRRLRALQYVDYFPASHHNVAYQRLLQSLHVRYSQVKPNESETRNAQDVESPRMGTQVATGPVAEVTVVSRSVPMPHIGAILNQIAPIFLIIFFILSALYYVGFDGNTAQFILGIFAILAGLYFLIKREIGSGLPMKVALLVFLIAYEVVSYGNYSGKDVTFVPTLVAGIAGLGIAGLLISNFRSPKKVAPYSSVVLAVFLFFIGSKLILNLFGIWPDTMYPIIMISAVIAAVLILLDL